MEKLSIYQFTELFLSMIAETNMIQEIKNGIPENRHMVILPAFYETVMEQVCEEALIVNLCPTLLESFTKTTEPSGLQIALSQFEERYHTLTYRSFHYNILTEQIELELNPAFIQNTKLKYLSFIQPMEAFISAFLKKSAQIYFERKAEFAKGKVQQFRK